jgi:hypothetical protein
MDLIQKLEKRFGFRELPAYSSLLAYPLGFSGSLLGGHPGLFPLLGNLGIVGFLPPGPSMSSPLISRYAEASEWTEGECRDQLCWCLDGKTSEYYALLVERNQEMVYMDLIRKLEKQFGFRELPETAQVQFNNARQTPDELLEDWADRVLSLATPIVFSKLLSVTRSVPIAHTLASPP